MVIEGLWLQERKLHGLWPALFNLEIKGLVIARLVVIVSTLSKVLLLHGSVGLILTIGQLMFLNGNVIIQNRILWHQRNKF